MTAPTTCPGIRSRSSIRPGEAIARVRNDRSFVRRNSGERRVTSEERPRGDPLRSIVRLRAALRSYDERTGLRTAFGQNFGRNYFDAERSPGRLNFDSSLRRRIPRVGYLSGAFSNFDPSPPPTGVDDRTRSRAGPRRAATYVRVIGRRVARGSPRNVPAARPITGTRSRTGLRSSTPVGLGRGSKFENGPER